ncbi:two-component system sensor histidine kinase CreC [Horticoccus sp. 23ND18S-11]|uniref:two-component system sensor histidine kinase CreC n=1 Tax=Horticoccus sp. 23ND18S-11 TaxID=3391832 RepID=UPI0039C9F68D
MKIRTAIFGVYVGASAIGFAGMMGFVLRDVRLRYVESMRRTLGDTALFLGAYVTEDLPAGEAWPGKLATLPPKADLLRVFACDRAGRVVFDSAHQRDVGIHYAWTVTDGAVAAAGQKTISNVAVAGTELCVATPVRRAGELLGWVGVGRPLASVVDGIREARWRIVVWLGSIAAMMVAAGWWIASKLTHSLERLTDYALAVRDGRPAEPPQSRAREVAALARAFEDMRVTLEGKAYVERYTQALAHEFKAPLSSIRGAAELLAENPPEADRQRFLGNLRAESARLQQIVERLLELAALESRRAGVAMSAIDFAGVVRDVHTAARAVAAQRGVTLSCAAGEPATVHGERFLLEQGVGNLVQNALEFTPVGGTITITLQRDAHGVRVIVDDTGPGVPDYAIEKIFERFYSLPRPDTGRKSSGLGLSIVREIARLHGGDVRLENRPEGGARAMLTLPLT